MTLSLNEVREMENEEESCNTDNGKYINDVIKHNKILSILKDTTIGLNLIKLLVAYLGA